MACHAAQGQGTVCVTKLPLRLPRYWPVTDDTRTATFSLAFDATTLENGCLNFVSGSHREEKLRNHRPFAENLQVHLCQAADCVGLVNAGAPSSPKAQWTAVLAMTPTLCRSASMTTTKSRPCPSHGAG